MHALHSSRVMRPLLWYLCIALTGMAIVPGEAVASLVPVDDGRGPHPEERLADLAKIQRVLESRLVRQRLSELGLTEQETSSRLARLGDEELHELALRIDEVAAGGSSVGVNVDWAALSPVLGYLLVLVVGLVLGLVWLGVRALDALRHRSAPSGESP